MEKCTSQNYSSTGNEGLCLFLIFNNKLAERDGGAKKLHTERERERDGWERRELHRMYSMAIKSLSN